MDCNLIRKQICGSKKALANLSAFLEESFKDSANPIIGGLLSYVLCSDMKISYIVEHFLPRIGHVDFEVLADSVEFYSRLDEDHTLKVGLEHFGEDKINEAFKALAKLLKETLESIDQTKKLYKESSDKIDGYNKELGELGKTKKELKDKIQNIEYELHLSLRMSETFKSKISADVLQECIRAEVEARRELEADLKGLKSELHKLNSVYSGVYGSKLEEEILFNKDKDVIESSKYEYECLCKFFRREE